MKNLLATITAYKAKKAEAEKLAKEVEKMKSELVQYMNEKATNSIICGQYVLTITECQKHSLDEKGIREKFPEIANEFEKITTYNRFTVK